ncbi:hypothetical protein PV379_01280 [Streptomyces caniscabiei]|uniref:hypothetical protein n=1 Tax=Streptomyces caniscabiei TaxID=2746961 RepID=UPI0029A59020|nr:hypothetical protein [Streptomyces caniscabiei]MDX2775986.1 hypothetical protein [Streptomyces caniscabiei]
MNYGAKIAKTAHSVTDPDAPAKTGIQSDDTIKEMVSGIGLAFILGAKEQLSRYQEAYSKVKTNPQIGVMYCLHEVLTLLEDLDTLSWYTQVCGETNDLNKVIRDMRNHARHDLRENINHESNDGRKKRAKKLGVHENLMVHIGFDENTIKMGTTTLTLNQASDYVEWAESILTTVMATGVKAGRIKGVELADQKFNG